MRGGTLIPNSWGCPWLAPLPDQRAAAGMYGGNYIQLTQSSWPLDPVKDFLTRPQATRHPRLGAGSPASYREGGIKFRNSGSGEHQNQYIMPAFRPSYLAYVVGVGDFGSPGALYSRKQTLGSYKSVVSPYGIVLPSTGALSSALDPREQIETFAGEAVWDCPTYAGINIQTGSTFTFQSQSSDPWFSDYETFQYDLKLAAKDYSIVPEFRISEHIADFKKYGLFGAHNSDIFEIPGTGINSAKSSSFYRDYSNSEFMKGFLNIKEDSGILPREIEIECEAAIRFNPYKGFYTVQRSLDLVSQWSSSYADGITVTVDGDGTTSMGPTIGSSSFGQKLLTDMGLYIRPMIAPLFAPGILYNSIKSGMAVDTQKITGDWLTWVNMLLVSDIAYVSAHLNYFRKHQLSVRNTTLWDGTLIKEHYTVFRYMKQSLQIPERVLEKRLDSIIYQLVKIITSKKNKIKIKELFQIIQNAKKDDPHVIQRFLRIFPSFVFRKVIGKEIT